MAEFSQNTKAQAELLQSAILSDFGLKDQAGLGVDIVSISHMKTILGRTKRFENKVFTPAEQDYCHSTSQPHVHLACRFAAKEAVVKALGCGFTSGIGPWHIEVVKEAQGRPKVQLHGPALSFAQKNGVVEIPLSLSYTHQDAVACALALTETHKAQLNQPKKTVSDIDQQFKAARSWLDNLD